MVRLNLEGIWIDLNDQEFELKWKHPIQNSLKGESSTYSTDITAALTKNNRLAFDYKIFTESSKTNKYIYGTLYVNNTSMRVRCYIKEFSLTSVKFYLEQFRSGGVSNLLKDTRFICNIHLDEIQKELKRDVLIDIQTWNVISYNYVPGYTLNNIFTAVSENGRTNIYATNLIQELAAFYGCTLNNAPTNYLVYSNQWKQRTNITASITNVSKTYSGSNYVIIDLMSTTPAYNIQIDRQKIISTTPFKAFVNIKDAVTTGRMNFYIENSLGGTGAQAEIGVMYSGDNLFETPIMPAGTYYITVNHLASTTFKIGVEAEVCYTDEELANDDFSDYADFALAGYYPCWQNLPKITAKNLIETIALCAGKMVEYLDDSINFIDLDKVFSWENAIDVSDKLISMTSKGFKFLTSNNATVTYSSGKVIASIFINDETLPSETNNVATIDAIRIQDDTGTERVKDKIVLRQLPTGHFEIINKLADIYAPTLNPKTFDAEFIYFPDNKKPLLIRQFGGIFIALESIMTTKNTITLKLLKLR